MRAGFALAPAINTLPVGNFSFNLIAALDGNSRANLCHHFLRVLDRVNDEAELLVGVERALQVHRHPLQSKLKHFTFSPPKKFSKKMFHLGLAKRFLVRTVHVIAGQHGRLEFRFLKKQSSLNLNRKQLNLNMQIM